MCDDCIKEIMFNLKQDEVLILENLKKNKCVNTAMSMSKLKLMPLIANLTEFKFNDAVGRLEIIGFISRNSSARPNKFCITPSGVRFLELYKIELTSAAQ
jgi:predicted transcriptional regulator